MDTSDTTDMKYHYFLQGIKRIRADIFANKAISESDKIWDKRGDSKVVMDSWLEEDDG